MYARGFAQTKGWYPHQTPYPKDGAYVAFQWNRKGAMQVLSASNDFACEWKWLHSKSKLHQQHIIPWRYQQVQCVSGQLHSPSPQALRERSKRQRLVSSYSRSFRLWQDSSWISVNVLQSLQGVINEVPLAPKRARKCDFAVGVPDPAGQLKIVSW